MKFSKILCITFMIACMALVTSCGSPKKKEKQGSGTNDSGTEWQMYELHNTITVKNSLTGQEVESALVSVYYEGTSSSSSDSCRSTSRSTEVYTDNDGVADFYTADYFEGGCRPDRNRIAHVDVSKSGFNPSSESVSFSAWNSVWSQYGTYYSSLLVHTMYLTPD